MTDIPSFTSFAPGFEFLQGLVKNAGSAIPGIGQWATGLARAGGDVCHSGVRHGGQHDYRRPHHRQTCGHE